LDREEILSIKKKQLDELSEYREKLYKAPQLRQLFFELTLRCNSACFHCGSRCTPQSPDGLPVGEYLRVLDEVEARYGNKMTQVCLTGGEPLLYGDFFKLAQEIHDRGFRWGMTSNGTLISREVARRLHETGMGTISISLDGLPETHDAFRRTPNGWKRAMDGVMNLLRVGGFQAVQITTVCSHKSVQELDALYDILKNVDIDSWRVVNMDPIGRAKAHPELLLTKEDYRTMFEFIRNKRIAGEPVCYGCSHYLGMEYEREVRDWYFLCTAGLYTASITVNGDIIACLDIEHRPEFIQGNILKDRFKDVWENRFEIFRRDLSEDCEKCRNCSEQKYCHGDAFHTWDFDNNCPQVCFKDILFD
jgi:radical SAM protein with 4Fe4S-binding SPASM domain